MTNEGLLRKSDDNHEVDHKTPPITNTNTTSKKPPIQTLISLFSLFFINGLRAHYITTTTWLFRIEFSMNPGTLQMYTSFQLFVQCLVKVLVVSCLYLSTKKTAITNNNTTTTWFVKFVCKNSRVLLTSSYLVAIIGLLGLNNTVLSDTPEKTLFCLTIASFGLAMSESVIEILSFVVPYSNTSILYNIPFVRKVLLGSSKGVENSWLDSPIFVSYIFTLLGSIVGRLCSAYVLWEKGHGARFLLGGVFSSTIVLNILVVVTCLKPISTFADQHVGFSTQHTPTANSANESRRLDKSQRPSSKVLTLFWIFLSVALIPNMTIAMSFWKDHVVDTHARTQAYIDTFGDLFGLLGLLTYVKFFSTLYQNHFKRSKLIYIFSQLALAVLAFSDVGLFYQWNVILNIHNTTYLILFQVTQSVGVLRYVALATTRTSNGAREGESNRGSDFGSIKTCISSFGMTVSYFWGGLVVNYLDIKRKYNLDRSGILGEQHGNSHYYYDFENFSFALWMRIGFTLLGVLLAICFLRNDVKSELEYTQLEDEIDSSNPSSSVLQSSTINMSSLLIPIEKFVVKDGKLSNEEFQEFLDNDDDDSQSEDSSHSTSSDSIYNHHQVE